MTSDIYELHAGPKKKRYFVHADILAQSDMLRVSIQGKWKESAECIVTLENWDPETVARLVEWLYSNDYFVPNPKTVEMAQEVLGISGPPYDGRWTPLKGLPKGIQGLRLKSEDDTLPRSLTPLEDLRFDESKPQSVPPSRVESFQEWTTHNIRSKHDLDYEKALIAHAKICSLGGYLLLPSLSALAFQRIQEILVFLDPIVPRSAALDNVLSLVRHVYVDIVRPGDAEEPLQKLVSTFVAINHARFESAYMSSLQETFALFARDVADKVKLYVATLEQRLRVAEGKRSEEGKLFQRFREQDPRCATPNESETIAALFR